MVDPGESDRPRGAGGGVPQRVRVTSSRRGASPYRAHTHTTDLREQTGLGEVYLEQLLHAHLRLSLAVIIGAGTVIGLLILVLAQVPSVHAVHIGPIPLPWVMIGLVLYPLAVIAAHAYVRHTERIDADFAETLSDP